MNRLVYIALLLCMGGHATAQTLKIATVTPEGSQWMRDMRAGATEIEQRTEGRVKLKFYGGGVQGNDSKVLGKIRIGALQGGAFTPSAISARYPDINLLGLPMVFDSEEEAAFVRSKMDAKLQKGLEEAGFVSFGFAAGGFAAIMSNIPVRSVDDMRSKRVWVPEGDAISYASMEALSLSPVTLPLTDVLTGLQTGLIDIVGVSPIGALVLQWHTKVKYMTELPLSYTIGFMAIDKKAFMKLSVADQAAMREVLSEMYVNFDRQNLIDNQAARETLLKQKIEVVEFGAEDEASLRKSMLDLNRRLAKSGTFSLELYNEMMSYVQEYRATQPGKAAFAVGR